MNRRGFLKALGLGGAAAVVAAPALRTSAAVKPDLASMAAQGRTQFEQTTTAVGKFRDATGPYVVGEQGPELVIPTTSGRWYYVPVHLDPTIKYRPR